MQPTSEQRDALDLFEAELKLAIEAGAGTGKTTTLQLLARSTSRLGCYLAFNRAIVDEAGRKMPRNVRAYTAHSLAMRSVGSQYRHRLDAGRMRSTQLARLLDVDPFVVHYGAQSKVLQPSFLASLVMRTITNYCFSDEELPARHHVPYVPGIDVPDSRGGLTWANNDAVRDHIAPVVQRAWVDICDVNGRLPYTHDHYLKLYERSSPVIPADFVMLDEAQDASPVMLSIMRQQTESQLVYVGDSQQQIYGWRGAVNALQSVAFDARSFLTQSFRFGPEIADVANLVLEELDAELRITGLSSIDSHVRPIQTPRCILTRSNAVAVTNVLQLLREGRRVYLLGGGVEVVRFARAAIELQETGGTAYPDLACFVSWAEVVEYVAQDPQGDELALLVSLVEEFGAQTIIEALDATAPEALAEITISTAHKAKGREWESVQLAEDYHDVSAAGSPEEWRLMYVAATRAQRTLDIMRCVPLRKLSDPGFATRHAAASRAVQAL